MEKLIYKDECYRIVGACMEVHRVLGCGFLEGVYQEALELELMELAIPYAKECDLKISYKDKFLQKFYKADFICYSKIILEIKALDSLTTGHEAQLLNYLKATGLKLGLLVNFGEKSFAYKRMIL